MLEEVCKRYHNEIAEILGALEYGFYEELEEYTFEEDVVYPFQEHYNKPFGWNNGATKGVLIFKDLGFVIKIPFSMSDGEELCGADEGNTCWDYCSQEENRYRLAKENRLQNIFLKTSLIGKIEDYPIYIQLFAEPLSCIHENSHFSSTKEDRAIVKDIIEENNYDYIDSWWEADIFTVYGGKYYKKFKKFVKEAHIRDLRDANIGYIGLKPVIFDYAGYNS